MAFRMQSGPNSFSSVDQSIAPARRIATRLCVVPALAWIALGSIGCSEKATQSAASGSGPQPAPAAAAAARSPFASAPAGQAQATGQVPAGQMPAGHPDNTFTGAIVESMNAAGYTYARLKGESREVWIAGPEFTPVSGEVVSVALDMPMENFESKTLQRSFPMLYFVSDVARNGQPVRPNAPAAPAMAPSHGASAPADTAPAVARLEPPPGGLSVADLFARKSSLGGKKVTVRGTVVKYNGGILDRNWLHIQDGSGAASQHTNDLTVTTTDVAKVGDVVTVTGVVGLDRDFTAGYAYDVLVENASLAR